MKPTVSVIMPLYNSSAFMDESIRSVLDQSFADLELILVDDCSTDDSLAGARALAAQDDRIAVVALPDNQGGGAARNAGIAAARGRYIAFLDSDDIWESEKLAVQLAAMEERKASFSYTDYRMATGEGDQGKTISSPDRVDYRTLLRNNVIGCSTVIYDRKVLGTRLFPLIRKRQDFGLWLSILRDIDFAWRCGPALTRYRIRQNSVSSNKLQAAAYTWKVYRELEALPLSASLYYFARYALSGIVKRL